MNGPKRVGPFLELGLRVRTQMQETSRMKKSNQKSFILNNKMKRLPRQGSPKETNYTNKKGDKEQKSETNEKHNWRSRDRSRDQGIKTNKLRKKGKDKT